MIFWHHKRIDYGDLPGQVREQLELLGTPEYDLQEAITLLRAVARKFPGFVPGRLNLAALLLEAGRTTEAHAVYAAVVKDFPGDLGATAGLATVLAAEKQYPEAERLARAALDHGYHWPPCHAVIAEAREQAGDFTEAAAAYLAAYEHCPHSWEYLQHYCRLLEHPYAPPDASPPHPAISARQCRDLLDFLDLAMHAPDAGGHAPGCNDTLRFTRQWAASRSVDPIALYQYLNAQGAFCDCEVCQTLAPEHEGCGCSGE